MVHMYCDRPFTELKIAAKAALEHHFNNHGWCPYLAKSVAERAEVQYTYRSKTEDSMLYSQCVEIHEAYTTVQGLRDLKHPYDINKCESMNKFMMKFVPKDSNFSGTRNWEGPVIYAVGVDSIGYRGYHHRVYSALGLEVRQSNLDLWDKLDHRKEWRKDYSERPDVRHKMPLTRHSKLMEELEKEKEDNLKGRQYASGTTVPMGGGGESSNRREKVPSSKAICSYCHNKGHKTKKSRLCLFSTSPNSAHFDTENINVLPVPFQVEGGMYCVAPLST
jgi:hypothetical protein